MKNVKIAAATVCGIAGLACAQGTMTITWEASDTGNGDGVVEPGESAVMTMFAQMTPGATGFAGSIYEIAGDSEWQEGTLVSFDNFLDALTDDGTLGGGNTITAIESFQLPPLFNPDFDASNPIALYQLVWTPADYTPAVVGFTSQNHLNFDVYTDDFGTSVAYDGEVFAGIIKVIPAPASLALLGFGGLVAGRRRR